MVLFYPYLYIHSINSSSANRKAPIFIGTRSCGVVKIDFDFVIVEHNLFDKLLISSFDPKILVEAKQIDKNCKTGYLYGPNHLITYRIMWQPFKFAKSLGCDAIHPHCMYVNKAYAEASHAAGLMLNPWTVDIELFINKMLDCGVDSIITNYPDVTGGLIEARR